MKIRIVKIALFLILLMGILYSMDKIYMFKYGDGIYPLTTFYELEEDTVDVLVLGSSRGFENINPAIMWDNYGIAAYDLCGSVQPMWNTYYYLKEALKTQTPKLVVLEAFRVVETNDYMDDSRIIKNNFGLKLSKDKVESVSVSAPPERQGEFLLEYVQYHNRYTDLRGSDYKEHLGMKNYEYHKGFGANPSIGVYETPNVSEAKEEVELSEKTDEYYRKTIELARVNDIPIMVVVAPYPIQPEEQKYFNKAESIAKEYGIKFLNYNLLYEEVQLDFSTDFANDMHLNWSGSTKFTTHLSKFINENFTFISHKGDEKWISWKKNAEDIKARYDNYKLTTITTRKEYFDALLQNKNYTVILSVDGCSGGAYDKIVECLGKFGVKAKQYDLTGVWVYANNKKLFEHADKGAYLFHQELGTSDLTIQREISVSETGEEQAIKKIEIDKSEYLKVPNGIHIMVYDNYTDSYVDTIGFSIDDFENAIR